MKKETTVERTKICGLNLGQEIIDFLKEKFDVFEGTLGTKIIVGNADRRNNVFLLYNGNVPINIHEYEVLVEDMLYVGTKEYDIEENQRKQIEGDKDMCFVCYPPQTLFNPIPFGSHLLSKKLNKDRKRPCIKVVFVSNKEIVNYNIQDRYSYYDQDTFKCSNYEHITDFYRRGICGNQVKLCDNQFSERLFGSFLNDIRYNVIIDEPITYENNERILDKRFTPLLKTSSDAIVSFLWVSENEITIALPQTTRKKDLLQRVFEELLFKYLSDYFPEVEESSWLKKSDYYVPGQINLLLKKAEIQQKYEDDIATIDKQIDENQKKYEFLHTLLTGTGSELVKAMILFLQWLGFDKVIDADSFHNDGENLEEDIDVDMDDNGLLVIEVKGIGGTSTDAQCSQIHKIVFRRSKERNHFDVRGLYIVNNQMHIEPLQRTVPPFTKDQLQDAENDDRGLAYTWQFFNLYFNIENGFFTKEEAQNRLLRKGLIDFTPQFPSIGIPYKYLHEGKVVCVELVDQEITVGNNLCYELNGRWNRAKVLSIQKEKEEMSIAKSGKIGLGLDVAVPKNCELYLEIHE